MSRLALQLRTLVQDQATVNLSLQEVELPAPGADEVVVRMEAAPVNPSDLGLLFAGADLSTARYSGSQAHPEVTADIPAAAMPALRARLGQSLPAGNEGAGEVVETGAGAEAQALAGHRVALWGGATYSTYRVVKAGQCLPLPAGTTAAEGASCFVNPLTVLGMVETMRMEGHKGLVHTAAASNLGQMLVKVCREEGIPLVNIVRRPEQVDLLKSIGAEYVCHSQDASFTERLVAALVDTKATLGFDATGGGRLTSDILAAMELAQVQSGGELSRYGSTVHKQVYIYGGLDRSPTTLHRAYGMAWGIGGWLLTPFLQKIGNQGMRKLQGKVVAGLASTFASSYKREIGLAEMLTEDAVQSYGRMATGEKYLINPGKQAVSPSI